MNIPNIEYLHIVLDSMQEGIVFHAPDTSILFANKTASRLLGMDQESLETKSAHNEKWEFVDEYSNILNIEHYPVSIILDTKKELKNYIIGKKFSSYTLWFNVSGKAIFDNKNNIDHIIISFTDITELKNTNHELTIYKHIVENADTGITIADMKKEDFPLTYVNPSFEKMTGYSKEESIGKNCRYLQGEDREQDGLKVIKDALREQKSCEVELKNYKKDGTLFYNLLTLSPIFNKEGKVENFVGVQHDITEIKKLQNKLIESKAFIQDILNTQANMIVITDSKKIEYVNKSLLDFFAVDDLSSFVKQYKKISKTFIENDFFFHLGKIDEKSNWIEEFQKLDDSEKIISILDKHFESKAFKLNIKEFKDERYILSFSDISETMLKQLEYMHEAYHDKLTGSLNRVYFEKNFSNIILNYQKINHFLALAILDIDHFKLVNDNYGHDVGDEVLVEFVNRINKYTRDNDDLLFRWGGEEFILLLKLNDKKHLSKALEHIRKIIEMEEFKTIGEKTCSIGATIYRNNEDIKDTIKRADDALYNSKETGRNKVTIKE